MVERGSNLHRLLFTLQFLARFCVIVAVSGGLLIGLAKLPAFLAYSMPGISDAALHGITIAAATLGIGLWFLIAWLISPKPWVEPEKSHD